MAITDTHFLEYDATADHDLDLYGPFVCTMTPRTIDVEPSLVSAPVVVAVPGYTRQWTFTGCPFTAANLLTLTDTVGVLNITYNATYPRLNVMTAATPAWTTYAVKLGSITHRQNQSDIYNRLVDVTFLQRGTSPYTFVVDHDAEVGSAVTLILDTNESVQQALLFSEQRTQSVTVWDQHTQTKTGVSPLTATVSGYVARASLDTLQQLLEDQTMAGMEVEGDVYDTQSTDGWYDTSLTASKAIITRLTQDQYWPGESYLIHVTLEVRKVVNP